MGVTKQAAQKRFVAKSEPGADAFSRFTRKARSTVVAATNEAHSAHNAEITPAHLILGLLTEPDALAAEILVAQGHSLDAVRAAATAATPPPSPDPLPSLIPYGAQAVKVLELTAREALRLNHNYIGTEHLLLALLEAEDEHGILTELGVHKEQVAPAIQAALEEITQPEA
jgi:ATP-dependent Clp protease ATP-binding subunit ClpA